MRAINTQVTQILSVLVIGLSVLGVYFSYRGIIGGRKVLARYAFWFFALILLERIARMLFRALTPTDPAVVRAYLALFSGIDIALTLVRYSATAVLAYGCYAALKDKMET